MRALLVGALAVLGFGLASAPAAAAKSAADLEQCRNGTFASPQQCVGTAWQNGNAGAQNSFYREGDSVPFRSVLTNLSLGVHTLVIEYDTIESGKHAYDYLTSYNRTETDANACSGISPCVAGTPGAIPTDTSIAFTNPTSTQVAGQISIWNGSIVSVTYRTADAEGKRSVLVTFNAASSAVVLAWGGHIASQIDWGFGQSAGAFNGSPYHMRLRELDDGKLGHMDRSLAAASVAPVPATFTTQVSAASITLGQSVTDLATLAGPNGTVGGSVSFFVCGPNLVSNPDCTSGGSAVGSAVILANGQANSAPYTPSQVGRYCFRAEYAPDGFAQYSPGNHTNLTTECFDVVQPLATLHVIKHVINDDGGTKVAADFAISVTGSNPSPSSFSGAESPGTTVSIQPGSFSVTEIEDAGYAASYAGCSGSIATNETKTCTITNNDKAGRLVVIKRVINDEGGTKSAADFAITVTGNAPAPASFAGAESPGIEVGIGAGAYGVTEGPHAGYEVSYSADCSGSISIGQTRTCTITNDDDVAPLVTVVKTASPTAVVEPIGLVTFSVDVVNVSEEAVRLTTLLDSVYGDLNGKGTCVTGGMLAASDGAAGGADEYSCSFQANVSGNAGTTHRNVVTVTVVDDEGDSVSGQDEATVSITDAPSSISVTKTANPVSLPEPGGDATFSVTVKNTSAVDSVTISSLADDVYGNLDGRGSCDVPQTLAAGASYSCSFTGAVSGNAGSSHRDVVTASGTDDDGNPVSGQDDATVTITAGPPPPPPPPAPVVVAAAAVTEKAIDLSITKIDRPDPVSVGASLTYTLTVRNLGLDTATNVTVADSLPASTRFVSVESSQGVCTGGAVIRCSLGTLARDAVATVTIVVRPLEPGVVINAATVVGAEPEANTANNTATPPTLVKRATVAVKGALLPLKRACPILTVQSRTLSAGRKQVVRAVVTAGGKGVRGVRIVVTGAGVRKAGVTDGRGRVAITVRPPRAGIVQVRMTNQPGKCSTRRIGVVGVFQPPSVTG